MWLSSRPCPNWFEGHFKTVLWPATGGRDPDRELRETVAYPLVEGLPSNYILEELLLDFLWQVPLVDGVGQVELDHLDYSFSMTKWTILGDHNLDIDNLQQSAHDWLDVTIDTFSKKFWASPVIAGNLKEWSKTYTPSPQLLLKYAILKELEKEDTRAPCDQEASITDNIWKRITELVTYEDNHGDQGREAFIHDIIVIFQEEGFEGKMPDYDYLSDIWVKAGGPAWNPPCDTSYNSWPEDHKDEPQFLLKYTLLKELEHERAACGEPETVADKIAAKLIALGTFADNGSGTDDGRDEMLQVIEDIYTEEHYEGEAHNFEYLHPIWIQHGGPARAKPGDWSSNEIAEDDGRPSPCDNPAAEGEILFCYDKVKCKLEEWTNYLFSHETNRFSERFQKDVWDFLRAEAGNGLEWPVGGHSLYVRVVIEYAWEVVKHERTPEAYAIAKWLYSVDFMKYQVSSEYNCEEPYLTKEDIHMWLSSRPCPNWFEGHFKTVLWPATGGRDPDRELRETVAYPLVEGLPSNYILEELLLDFLWQVPLVDGVGQVELDHLDYSFSMTKWTILGDHNLDIDNLQQSAHDWLDVTIDTFSKKFWASPVIAGNLKEWSKTYTPSPQLLTKYALIKEVEAEGRAACSEEASVADNVWKGLTDLTTYTGDSAKDDFFTDIKAVYTSAGHEAPSDDRLNSIWNSASGN